MKAEQRHQKRRTWKRTGLVVAGLVLVAGAGLAQTASFEQLVYARQTSALLEHDGYVIGGIAGGGLVFWPVDDLAAGERLTAGQQLSGNDVTDLAWSGRHVWVATRGGGLTRISDVAGDRRYRQFVPSRNSLNVTAVVGTLIGASEWVYYGIAGGGVGVIIDGLSGTVWTTQDGLISDNVTSLQVRDGVLFVGTSAGISRFANNVFTNENTGLSNLLVHDLALDSDGSLLAGTEGGLFRWDDGSRTWSVVGGQTAPVFEVSCAPGLIYTRSSIVRVYNGTNWQTLGLPAGTVGAIHAGADFWVGGSAGAASGSDTVVRNAYLGRRTGPTSFAVVEIEASQVLSGGGVVMRDDVPYIGAQVWQSVISSRHAGTWEHLRFQAPTPENVGQRLSEGVLLSMATGPDGAIWAGLYAGTGLARLDPVTGVTDLISPANSGMAAAAIINVIVHPDGPVITMHDQEDFAKVEILVDPDNWADSANWLALPRDAMSAVDATDVNDAVVQRRDVVWFAVLDVGLVRWDINGDLAGPDDPLTWFDQADDAWDILAEVDGSQLDLGAAFGLEVGSDGTIWVGGNGLLQFSWDDAAREATLLTSMAEKGSTTSIGLVNANVSDIVRDANGHIWVATSGGMNRVRGSGQQVAVDAYFDLGNYFATDNNSVLYTPNVIVPLPGTSYRRICASGDRRQVLVSADQGAALITVGSGGGSQAPTLAEAYLYPNPYLGQTSDGGLKLGGLPDDEVAAVEIYNLDGQLVYQDPTVAPGQGFWTGTNRVGSTVATGMYVVRVTVGGVSQALMLSVVR